MVHDGAHLQQHQPSQLKFSYIKLERQLICVPIKFSKLNLSPYVILFNPLKIKTKVKFYNGCKSFLRNYKTMELNSYIEEVTRLHSQY